MNDLTNYKEIRPQMRTGDMLEFATDSLLGWTIRTVTRQKVNHTAGIINIKFPGMEERRFCLEALEHGIELNILSKRLERFDGKVYYTPLKDPLILKRNKIGRFMLEHVGTPYDYRSLFRNMFGWVSQDAKRFFCSEYYQMSLVAGGLLEKGKAIRPGEFKHDIFGKEIRFI